MATRRRTADDQAALFAPRAKALQPEAPAPPPPAPSQPGGPPSSNDERSNRVCDAIPDPPPPPLPPLPDDPIDRVWELVARECPAGRSAEEHRRVDAPFVHVVPMGHDDDVRCLAGEPMASYAGFYRPVGGHKLLVPSSARLPTEAERARGARDPAPVPSRKTWTYLNAEMAGREAALPRDSAATEGDTRP